MIAARRCCEDIAVLTGGRAITEDLGIKLENGASSDDLGKAKKITIDKDNTTIVEGGGKPEDIEGRVKQIRTQIDETTSDYDKREAPGAAGQAGRRRGRDQGRRGHRDRDEGEEGPRRGRDARDQGGCRGGHRARRRRGPCSAPSRALDKVRQKAKGDAKTGVDIVRRALEEPLRQISTNAGLRGRRRGGQGARSQEGQ